MIVIDDKETGNLIPNRTNFNFSFIICCICERGIPNGEKYFYNYKTERNICINCCDNNQRILMRAKLGKG